MRQAFWKIALILISNIEILIFSFSLSIKALNVSYIKTASFEDISSKVGLIFYNFSLENLTIRKINGHISTYFFSYFRSSKSNPVYLLLLVDDFHNPNLLILLRCP
jgi:hypothetical protein